MTSDELEDRLTRWATWARGPSIGSTNSSVGYMKERVDRACDSAEMTDEIAITERAVARTKLEDKRFWRVISRYYLGSLAEIEIAMDLQISEPMVKSLLLRARGRISNHILGLDKIDIAV